MDVPGDRVCNDRALTRWLRPGLEAASIFVALEREQFMKNAFVLQHGVAVAVGDALPREGMATRAIRAIRRALDVKL